MSLSCFSYVSCMSLMSHAFLPSFSHLNVSLISFTCFSHVSWMSLMSHMFLPSFIFLSCFSHLSCYFHETRVILMFLSCLFHVSRKLSHVFHLCISFTSFTHVYHPYHIIVFHVSPPNSEYFALYFWQQKYEEYFGKS